MILIPFLYQNFLSLAEINSPQSLVCKTYINLLYYTYAVKSKF